MGLLFIRLSAAAISQVAREGFKVHADLCQLARDGGQQLLAEAARHQDSCEAPPAALEEGLDEREDGGDRRSTAFSLQSTTDRPVRDAQKVRRSVSKYS
jgi:hypothetical protein